MNSRKFFHSMESFHTRAGLATFVARIGLAAYLVWHGLLTFTTEPVLGGVWMALGGIFVIGLFGIITQVLIIALLVWTALTTGPAPEHALALGAVLAVLLSPKG